MMLISSALFSAGFQRDSLDCETRPPPPGSGVSPEARVRVIADPQLFPLGVRRLYKGPQGRTIEVSDIKLWHSLVRVR